VHFFSLNYENFKLLGALFFIEFCIFWAIGCTFFHWILHFFELLGALFFIEFCVFLCFFFQFWAAVHLPDWVMCVVIPPTFNPLCSTTLNFAQTTKISFPKLTKKSERERERETYLLIIITSRRIFSSYNTKTKQLWISEAPNPINLFERKP
jgi:hypothetical protein